MDMMWIFVSNICQWRMQKIKRLKDIGLSYLGGNCSHPVFEVT